MGNTFKKCKKIQTRAKKAREIVHKKEKLWIDAKAQLDKMMFLYEKLRKAVLHWEFKALCKNSPDANDEKMAKMRLGETKPQALKTAKDRIKQALDIVQRIRDWHQVAEVDVSIAQERAKAKCTQTALKRLEQALKLIRTIRTEKHKAKPVVEKNQDNEQGFKTRIQQRDEAKLNAAEK